MTGVRATIVAARGVLYIRASSPNPEPGPGEADSLRRALDERVTNTVLDDIERRPFVALFDNRTTLRKLDFLELS